MSLQEKERTEELRQYMIPYLENETVCSMDEYVQHGTTSTLQHCLSVMRLSCALASQLHIRVNIIIWQLVHYCMTFICMTGTIIRMRDRCTALRIRTLPVGMQCCIFRCAQRFSILFPPICGR